MNTRLWSSILNYNFDEPTSAYGFSTRLAKENYWTADFAAKAIIEYKKFMYLAATEDLMVSPSEIVDIVWHQHLVFTQSYNDFCTLIGKQVQHVPSTHNRTDAEKFKQAKERTKKLYHTAFGKQAEEVWEYASMYDSLELEKGDFKIRTVILIGVLIFTVLIIPFYFLLKPLYIHINNPAFSGGVFALAFIAFVSLEIVNYTRLEKIMIDFMSFSFIRQLKPLELIYLKTGKLENVIHGIINQYVKHKIVAVNKDSTLSLKETLTPNSSEEFVIMEVLSAKDKHHYPAVLSALLAIPVFHNISNCMDAFQKYFVKSKVFAQLFYLNFGVLASLVMIVLQRFIIGTSRGKPAELVLVGTIVLLGLVIFFLKRLTTLMSRRVVPNFYKAEATPKSQSQTSSSWEWHYFLLGDTFLTPSFKPLTFTSSDSSSSSSSSDSSSCGSSCSSCGGCGGD